MNTFHMRILALLLSSALAVVAADIQLPLVASGAKDSIRAYMPQSASASKKQPASVTKLPADLVAPVFGQFKFGPKESPMTIAFAFDDPPGKPARLLIDANGNGDLTDDPAPEWSMRDMERNGKPCRYGEGKAMLYLAKDDEASKVRLNLYRFVGSEPSMRGDLQYYPDYARIGKVEIEGKSYAAILHDEYASGDFRHSATTLKLDLNGNGRFDTGNESFRTAYPFKVGDAAYEVTGISANGDAFQIMKSTRPVPEVKPQTTVTTVRPGQPAPVFEATAITGQKISLPGSYKGKIVLLDFWATWCGPCIGELPHLIKAYEKHHAKGLEVLGISLDSEKTAATLPEFLKAKNMTWPQVCDGKGWSAEIGRLYGVRSIPAAFLIDGTTGIVLATQGLRGTQLSDTIQAALSKKLTPENAANATASRKPVSLSNATLTGSKWSGGANFWIEFRANGDYREFWRNGEYPGSWKVLSEKEVSVSRKDGWDYVFKPTADGSLLRVWKPKPGQELQDDLVFRPMTTSSGGAAPSTSQGIIAVWQANGDAMEGVSKAQGELRKVTFAEGAHGQAFDFTAADSAVVMSVSALNQNFSAMSIVAWAKARSHGQADYDGFGRTIISRTEDGGFALRVIDGRVQLDLRTEDGRVHKLAFQHPPLALNTWVHVGATYDGKTATAYVDGRQVGSPVTVSGRIKKTTRPTARLMIGNEPGSVPDDPAGIIQPGHFQWDGLLDQVAVYERALSSAEIELIRVRSRAASATAGDGTNRNHMFEMMRIAATDRDGALKTLFDGLQNDPLKNPWGLEVTMIFQSDERRALTLKGEEREKLFIQCRDYLLRARALSEEALKKHPGNESLTHDVGKLDDALARASLELGDTAKAKELAVKQLAANTDTKSWNYGNVIHEANSTLGRAALREGDKKSAADFLRKAGATPGSPQLNSFGPDWTLAREMVEEGETQAVFDYFDLVEKFWAKPKSGSSSSASLSTRHKQKLDQWRAEVRDGKVPDFRP